jgi:hypothetical protein
MDPGLISLNIRPLGSCVAYEQEKCRGRACPTGVKIRKEEKKTTKTQRAQRLGSVIYLCGSQ